jgi:hypothetical protein
MCSIASKRPLLARQDGAALAISIILLLTVAAMALVATTLSSTDFVVAGNDRQFQASLDVAEAGLAEAMHRLSLTPGTMVTANGVTFDASIRDPSDPPDPNWRARIFLTAPNAAPAGGASDFHTGTIQSGDPLLYSDASDATKALTIQHRLFDFNGDGTSEVVLYDPSRIPAENPVSGQPVERITVRGQNGLASRMIQVDAIRFPLTINALAALSTDGEVDLRGNVTVCGHDHRIDTPEGTQLPNCSPNWDEPDGHLNAVMTTGDTVGTQGSVDLLGSPTATNTDPTNPFLSLAQTLGVSQADLQDILDSADHYAIDADPLDGITVIDGDVQITGQQEGTGLLYVRGNLRIGGGFAWRGLVYVEGTLENHGNTWILGGVVVRGDGALSVDFGSGTPTILYSRDMLTQALLGSMDYIVLNWKEI